LRELELVTSRQTTYHRKRSNTSQIHNVISFPPGTSENSISMLQIPPSDYPVIPTTFQLV
jgi:hypothetical protein